MGFWSNKSKLVSLPVGWKSLESMTDLDEALELSNQKTVVIFKHSTRCGISMAAKRRLELELEVNDRFLFYYLDLLKHRDISNAIVQNTNVMHQSPQLIVVKSNDAVAHGSHQQVSASLINSNV